MSFKDMVHAVKMAAIDKQYIVLCLSGPAGIGKTAAVKQAAQEMAAEGEATGKVVTIIASQILPNEVSGITMPVVEKKAMEIFDHYRLSTLEDGDILFFDELLEADRLVLSACLTLIESRELMSGRKLPDIQIVAATNPTVQPNMLKENIRQRFAWQDFDLDQLDCRNYIIESCGFDIGSELAAKITCTGGNYNILTPRSMTKMCHWMSKATDEEMASKIADAINNIWHSSLGTQIYKAWLSQFMDPLAQVRRGIMNACATAGADVNIEDMSIEDMMDLLKSLPEWPTIEEELAKMEMTDTEDIGGGVNF